MVQGCVHTFGTWAWNRYLKGHLCVCCLAPHQPCCQQNEDVKNVTEAEAVHLIFSIFLEEMSFGE